MPMDRPSTPDSLRASASRPTCYRSPWWRRRLRQPSGCSPGAGRLASEPTTLLKPKRLGRRADLNQGRTVRHVGHPDDAFPHQWGVLEWLDGADAWTARESLHGDLGPLAVDVARTIRAIGRLPDMPVAGREPGDRGGPIEPLLRRLEWWLTDSQWNAASLVDVAAVRRIAAEVLELADHPVIESFERGPSSSNTPWAEFSTTPLGATHSATSWPERSLGSSRTRSGGGDCACRTIFGSTICGHLP